MLGCKACAVSDPCLQAMHAYAITIRGADGLNSPERGRQGHIVPKCFLPAPLKRVAADNEAYVWYAAVKHDERNAAAGRFSTAC